MKTTKQQSKMLTMGMLGMMLALGLALIGCDNGSTSGGDGNITTDLNYSSATDDVVLVFRDAPRTAARVAPTDAVRGIGGGVNNRLLLLRDIL